MLARDSSITDFERYGFVERQLAITGRAWLLTIDFEAFAPEMLDDWIQAMHQWASYSARSGWRFSIFIAVEDVVRLRAARRPSYDRFLQAAKELFDAGSAFHPHNHGVFDAHTGLLAPVRPQQIPGYRKRASFAYDVIHRHQRDLREWVGQVISHYDRFLSDAGISRPERLAFRAGGWDHGDTAELTRHYVEALEQNGFAIDSSASSGAFGTRNWRVGAPYRSNVFLLPGSIVEVAPCWSINAAAELGSRETLGAFARLARQPQLWLLRSAPGGFVSVLHFDHLLRAAQRGSIAHLASRETVEERIARFFKLLSLLRASLHLESMTFDGLRIRS